MLLQEVEQVVEKQNSFCQEFNFYPPQTVERLAGSLSLQPFGFPINHYFIAKDRNGNILAGLSVIDGVFAILLIVCGDNGFVLCKWLYALIVIQAYISPIRNLFLVRAINRNRPQVGLHMIALDWINRVWLFSHCGILPWLGGQDQFGAAAQAVRHRNPTGLNRALPFNLESFTSAGGWIVLVCPDCRSRMVIPLEEQ